MPDIPKVNAAAELLISALQDGCFDYAIVGGMAVILNGYDRSTEDVDALIWDLDERLPDLMRLLEERGFRVIHADGLAKARATRVLHLRTEDGIFVDVMLGLVPFEREAIDRATTMRITERTEARVATPEDLMILKLIANRPRDQYDVANLIELYPHVDKKRIRRIVANYAEALDDPEIMKNLKLKLG